MRLGLQINSDPGYVIVYWSLQSGINGVFGAIHHPTALAMSSVLPGWAVVPPPRLVHIFGLDVSQTVMVPGERASQALHGILQRTTGITL